MSVDTTLEEITAEQLDEPAVDERAAVQRAAAERAAALAAVAPVRTRTLRAERLVPLRSRQPMGRLTLRHELPVFLGARPGAAHHPAAPARRLSALPARTPKQTLTTTPKVDRAQGAVETTAGKGGDAR